MIDNKYRKYEPFFGKWRISKELGKGAFGRVFEIYWDDDLGGRSTSALKVIHIPSDEALQNQKDLQVNMEDVRSYFLRQVERIKDEIRILQKCKGHNNIVSYEDHMIIDNVGEDGIGWDILIRMELLYPLGPYFDRKEASQYDIIRMWLDITSALIFCEDEGIIHRDIKPANILISKSGNYKLSDFGVARKNLQQDNLASTRVGTEKYMAPEVYRNQKYDKRADYYSLGCVIYYFLNKKRHPFYPPYPQKIEQEDVFIAENKLRNGEKIPAIKGVSKEANEILLKAISHNPTKRFRNAREMYQAIQQVLSKQGYELSSRYINIDSADGFVGATAGGRTGIGTGTGMQPVKKQKSGSSALPVAVAGVMLVAGIGGVVYGVYSKKDTNENKTVQLAEQEDTDDVHELNREQADVVAGGESGNQPEVTWTYLDEHGIVLEGGVRTMSFTKAYHASGEWQLSDIMVILEHASLTAGQFTVEMRDPEGNILQEKENDTDGKVVFDPIAYTEDDINQEYTYTIAQNSEAEVTDSVNLDTTEYTVQVKVEDSEGSDGILLITAEVPEMAFVNTFSGSSEMKLVDAESNPIAEVKVRLYAEDESGKRVPYTTEETSVYVSDENGVVSVENLEEGNYVFVIEEIPEGYVLTETEYPFFVGAQADENKAEDNKFEIIVETEPIPITRLRGDLEHPGDGDTVDTSIKLKGWLLTNEEVGGIEIYGDILANGEVIQSSEISYSELGENTFEKRQRKNEDQIAAAYGYEFKGTQFVEDIPDGTYTYNLRVVDVEAGEEEVIDSAEIKISNERVQSGNEILEMINAEEETKILDISYIFADKGYALGLDIEDAETVIAANPEQIILTGWLNAPDGTSLGMFLEIDSQLYTTDALAELGGSMELIRVPRYLEEMDSELIGNTVQDMEEAGYVISLNIPFLADGEHKVALAFNVGLPGENPEIIDMIPLTIQTSASERVVEGKSERIISEWEMDVSICLTEIQE